MQYEDFGSHYFELGFDQLPVFNPSPMTSSWATFDISHGEVLLDTSILMPGDVVLTSAKNGLKRSAVEMYQHISENEMPKVYRRWTHVGIVGMDGKIWDVMPKYPVRSMSIREYFCQDSCVEGHVRRLNLDRLSERTGVRLSFESDLLQEFLGFVKGFPYWDIMDLGKHFIPRMLDQPQILLEKGKYICSTLVQTALEEALLCDGDPMKGIIFETPDPSLPCYYRASNVFDSVQVSAYKVLKY